MILNKIRLNTLDELEDELFTFIWNFKHGDNIMYNFKILKALMNSIKNPQ